MFNDKLFLESGITESLYPNGINDANDQIATKVFIETILKYAEETIGKVTPVINGADPKDVKTDFIEKKEINVKIDQQEGFLRIVDSNTLELRDVKGDIILLRMPALTYNSDQRGDYSTELQLSSLIVDDNDNKGIFLSSELIPLSIDQGVASIYGRQYSNQLYFNGDSLSFGHFDYKKVMGNNFFLDTARYMAERSIKPDNSRSDGKLFAEKSHVATTDNCKAIVELIGNYAGEHRTFREDNNSVSLS